MCLGMFQAEQDILTHAQHTPFCQLTHTFSLPHDLNPLLFTHDCSAEHDTVIKLQMRDDDLCPITKRFTELVSEDKAVCILF